MTTGDGSAKWERRPVVADQDLVEAIGKASEAAEYVERARGHLYSFHQLIGRADLLFGDAASMLADAGYPDDAAVVTAQVVGRNVLEGRWTFQVVDEFDALYWEAVRSVVRGLELEHLDGRRHEFEARTKVRRQQASADAADPGSNTVAP